MVFSQADINRLDSLLGALDKLVQNEQGVEAPLTGELDGFLTAIVVSPQEVPQAEWLKALLPGVERMPPAEMERLIALVLARKAAITAELLRGVGRFEPIYEIDTRNDDILWETWIDGFDRAMQLRLSTWLPLRESGDAELFQAFMALTALVLLARGESLDPIEDEDLSADAADLIPMIAEVLYCHQRGLPTSARVSEPEPQQPIHVVKIGRNEPCPCGSGKKYKKCCLG